MTTSKNKRISNIRTGDVNMQKKPEIIVFAGPNGSGKSTITKMANIIEPYVNADDIKKQIIVVIWTLLFWLKSSGTSS